MTADRITDALGVGQRAPVSPASGESARSPRSQVEEEPSAARGARRAAERPRAGRARAAAPDEDEPRHESGRERLDRNLEELTGELRVVVTGVQVLFAFLLVVPFDSGFAGISAFERTVYFVTLILAALSAACTIAPSAQHRFLFRQDDKAHLVFVSNRIVIAGLAFLGLAMCGAVLLVATKLFGVTAGVITGVLAAIPLTTLWFAMPLRRRRASRSRADRARRHERRPAP